MRVRKLAVLSLVVGAEVKSLHYCGNMSDLDVSMDESSILVLYNSKACSGGVGIGVQKYFE
jgi:hypothetical protein